MRHGHPSDLPYLYEICHRTGFSGQDATGVIGDRALLGQYFAAPYLVRDVHWCWVAADGEGVAGYLVTTPDSRSFCDWMNSDWLPSLRELYPQRDDPSWSVTETWLRTIIHEPATCPDFVDAYPAHLHIDFLPRAQGQGWGTQALDRFLKQLRSSGVPGFHLGVGSGNTKARVFYLKQGFDIIQEEPGVVFFGLRM